MKLPIQLDRYTLVEAIGAGAFGRVYRAEVRGDMGFVSDFAVKVLDSNVVQTNPNVAAQMADEARLLSQLDHPNIVKVIDFKHVDHFVLGDVYMMVLEFVRGVDVAEVLERLTATRSNIPATAVLHMGLMVADALNHAYSMQTREGNALRLVHRDLKPHNLMVNFRGQVKILDFGIAKAKSARMAAATQEGQTKGTVFYMSPEQLAGEALDGRSDLYSLGTILFELLYGRRLLDVEVNTPADLARAMHTAFEMDVEIRLDDLKRHMSSGANGDLSEDAIEGWLALLRATLQKDARYRPDNASVFAEQLEWLRAKHPPGDRGYWPSVVEDVASARAARGGRSLPPLQPAPPRTNRDRAPHEVPPSDISNNESAQDFFGMESGNIADDSPAQLAAAEVPMTRAMSSVRGSVRSFGSEQVLQISPLTEVIAKVRSGEESGPRRMDDSTDSLIVPGISRKTDTPIEAPTVEVDSVAKTKAPPGMLLTEPDTVAPAQARPPKRAARRPAKEKKARPVILLLGGVAVVLVVLIGWLLSQRGGPDPSPTTTASTEEP
ncbi:MAG: serine/threonine protein kinase, partial [Deltaproteobacteria bacterium]|nr:serine/threonine protein kinase [Deltaproteobacteria bacterium]